MSRLLPAAIAILAAAGLSGCSNSGLALMGVDAASYIASGRSISGNLIYAMTGKDCAPLNLLAGRPPCHEEPAKAEEPPVYCYRTLGQVDCHSEPDPMMSPTTRLYRTEVAAKPVEAEVLTD
jgi:hypothetical protein